MRLVRDLRPNRTGQQKKDGGDWVKDEQGRGGSIEGKSFGVTAGGSWFKRCCLVVDDRCGFGAK
jgi:hypothetical protein